MKVAKLTEFEFAKFEKFDIIKNGELWKIIKL